MTTPDDEPNPADLAPLTARERMAERLLDGRQLWIGGGDTLRRMTHADALQLADRLLD